MSNDTQIMLQQTSTLSQKFNIGGNPEELIHTLKATVFKGNPTNEQFTALLIVASQYGLNPFTREIYAFPDNNNGIVPVVGVDGWARILNGNPQFDGMDFEQNDDSCTCRIYRKDRSHPVVVTEFMSECRRDTKPWKSHPKRMLRHKTMIQAARLAFGFAGIFDEDEADRVRDAQNGIQPNQNGVQPNQTDPFNGQVNNPTREQLLAEAQIFVNKGDPDGLRDFWHELSKEQRAIIGKNKWGELGNLAKRNQANTFDATLSKPKLDDAAFQSVLNDVRTGDVDYQTVMDGYDLTAEQQVVMQNL